MSDRPVQPTDPIWDSVLQEAQAQTAVYFNSLESVFQYTVTQSRSKTSSRGLFIGLPIGVLFLFSMLPLIPSLLAKNVPRFLGDAFHAFGLSVPLDSMFLWWPVCFISSYILWRIYESYDQKLTKASKAKELPNNLRAFCYLYQAVKEIRAFIVNQRHAHLDQALSSLDKYAYWSDSNISSSTVSKYLRVQVSAAGAKVYDIIRMLSDNFAWFVIDDRTKTVCAALAHFDTTLRERIRQGIEIDIVAKELESLVLYEYALIRKPVETKLTAAQVSMSDLGLQCLWTFARNVSALSELEKPQTTKVKLSAHDVLVTSVTRVGNMLKHRNLVVCFLSWYVFLSVLFIPISLLTIRTILSISIDSTIIIGVLTAPFAASIAFATAIYSKSSK